MIAILGLTVGTLILYSPVRTHPFNNYDDPEYILSNAHVRQGLSWETIRWALTTTEQSNWHPLTWISHALDYQLFGLDAAGHHWTSVVIHALNAVLLFVLLRRSTGAMGRSLIVAALFACHPLNVESVAWIAERKNVLSTLFFLLTLGAYGYYSRKPGLKRYGLMAGSLILGLAAKPMLVTLPFVMLLMDYWPLCRIAGWTRPSQTFPSPQASLPQLILEKLPLIALAAGSAVVTVVAQHTNLAPAEQFPLAMRLENAPYSYFRYLVKGFWPTRLALFYPHPGNALSAWQWIGATALLMAITALAWKQRSTRPYLLVGWLWFLGTLIPVLGIVQVGAQAMADRYAYVPLIGIFVAVVWSVNVRSRAALIALAAAVLIALSVATSLQLGYWKSDTDLWSHTLAVTENNLVAEDKLGAALQALGRQDEAMIHFTNAARLNPLDPLSNFSIGADLHWHGRLQQAIPHYQVTIQQTTNAGLLADAYQNLGTAYLQLGERVQARESFLLALKANPDLLTVFAGLGELTNEAARTLSRSVVQHPSSQGYLELGRLFQQDGRVPEAGLAYAEALKLDPQFEDARAALAGIGRAER